METSNYSSKRKKASYNSISEANEVSIVGDCDLVFVLCNECHNEFTDDELDYDTGLCHSCLTKIEERLSGEYIRCPDCNGTGCAYIGKQCETCGGQGEI